MGIDYWHLTEVLTKQQLTSARWTSKSAINLQNHAIPRNGVFYIAQPFQTRFPTSKIPRETRLRTFAKDLNIRQLPESSIDHTLWPLSHPNSSPIPNKRRPKHSRLRSHSRHYLRQFIHLPILPRKALFLHWTVVALRLPRQTNRRAQFHQSFVEFAARILLMRRLHQSARSLPQRSAGLPTFWITAQSQKTRQNPRDIPIHNRRRQTKRDAPNRSRRVTSNPLKLENRFESIRKNPAMLRNDLLRRLLQIPRPRIVAKPFPQLQNTFRLRARQLFNRRKFPHPSFPIRNHCLHLRLLQHHLADMDRVRIAGPSPRQIAFVHAKPGNQLRSETGRGAHAHIQRSCRAKPQLPFRALATCSSVDMRPR
jgi:hypothetical protein